MNGKIVLTKHGMIRIAERLFGMVLYGETDNDKYACIDDEARALIKEFAQKSIRVPTSVRNTLSNGQVAIDGFEGFRAKIEIVDGIPHIITILEEKRLWAK